MPLCAPCRGNPEDDIVVPPPKLKLVYFDFTGRAESIRVVLRLANIAFEDIRIPHADWPTEKPRFSFNHLPVLQVDDNVEISESLAILEYVGKLACMVPSDALQAALVDTIIHVADDVITDVVPWIKAPPEKKEAFAEECWKEAFQRLTLLDSYIQKHLKNGYAVGGQISIADVMVYTTMKILEVMPVPVVEETNKKLPAILTVFQSVSQKYQQ